MNSQDIMAIRPPARPNSLARQIFLTGANGFVGRNVIRHFTNAGDRVVALVRSTEAADRVRSLGAWPVMGDILQDNLASKMMGCQTLIHAAADTSHGLGSRRQWEVDVQGTRQVMAAARAGGITRAIHMSTESVLLNGKPLVNATEELAVPRRGIGMYSHSKAEAERVALALHEPSFQVVVLRPRFLWGRDDSTALQHLLDAVRTGKFAWIDGGNYLTSTTHIANLMHAIDLTLSTEDSGTAYFISDGPPLPFRRFVTDLLETQGVQPPDRSVPGWLVRTIAAVAETAGRLSYGRWDPPVTRQMLAPSSVEVTLNIGKACTRLGYRPVMSHELGLQEMRA